MIVLCAGGNRSGSTWQYNVVRLIGAAAGQSVYGAWHADYDPARPEAMHVIKAHRRDVVERIEADVVLGAFRDLRDVAVSYARMNFAGDGAIGRLRSLVHRHVTGRHDRIIRDFLSEYIANVAAVGARAAHMMRYEAMIADPRREIATLASVLGFALPDDAIAGVDAAIRAIRPPGDRPTGVQAMDPETLLHPGHLSGGSGGDARFRAIAERGFAPWLVAHGYPCTDPARKRD